MKILAGHVQKSDSEGNTLGVTKNTEKIEMTIDMEADSDTATDSNKPASKEQIRLLGLIWAKLFQPNMQKIKMTFCKIKETICLHPRPKATEFLKKLAVFVFTFMWLMGGMWVASPYLKWKE